MNGMQHVWLCPGSVVLQDCSLLRHPWLMYPLPGMDSQEGAPFGPLGLVACVFALFPCGRVQTTGSLHGSSAFPPGAQHQWCCIPQGCMGSGMHVAAFLHLPVAPGVGPPSTPPAAWMSGLPALFALCLLGEWEALLLLAKGTRALTAVCRHPDTCVLGWPACFPLHARPGLCPFPSSCSHSCCSWVAGNQARAAWREDTCGPACGSRRQRHWGCPRAEHSVPQAGGQPAHRASSVAPGRLDHGAL